MDWMRRCASGEHFALDVFIHLASSRRKFHRKDSGDIENNNHTLTAKVYTTTCGRTTTTYYPKMGAYYVLVVLSDPTYASASLSINVNTRHKHTTILKGGRLRC